VVEVKLDNGAWSSASGTTSWTYTWSTSGLAENGVHTIYARSKAGTKVSAEASVSVTKNTPPAASASNLNYVSDNSHGNDVFSNKANPVVNHTYTIHANKDVTWTVAASDTSDGVSGVKIYSNLNSTYSAGVAMTGSGNGPYTNTFNLPNQGSDVYVWFIATDGAGNTTTPPADNTTKYHILTSNSYAAIP